MGRPLKIAKAQAILTITDTDATTEEVTVSENLSTLGVIKGMSFVPASTTGGLSANTTYWILRVTGNSTFTVSATDLSANPTFTPVNLSATSGTTVSASVGVVDAYFNNPNGGVGFPTTNSNTYSVVGGDTAIIGPQILARVAIGQTGSGTLVAESGNTTVIGTDTLFSSELAAGSVITTVDGTTIGFVDSITTDTELELATAATQDYTNIGFVYATNEAGYIVRQKGKQKYLVKGVTSGLVGSCYTANLANADLTPNTMRVVATYANSATQTVHSISDHTGELFTATSGPVATGNIVFQYAAPVFATFNTAATANAANGMPYSLVQISNA